MRLDPTILKHEISALIVSYPEMAEDEQLRADMLEGATNFYEFLSALVRQIGETQALIGGNETYMAAIKSRNARMERRVEALRHLIHRLMDVAALRKAELPEATVSIRNGSAKVIVTDEAVIPERFCRTRREPMKTVIKEALEAGETVPGAELSNCEPSLAIRMG